MENADVCCSWVTLQAHLVYSSCGMPARQIKPIPSLLIHWCVLCACLQRKMGIFSTDTASHNKSAHKQNDLRTTRDITFRALAFSVETSGTTSPTSSNICRITNFILYCATHAFRLLATTRSCCMSVLVPFIVHTS